MNRRQVVLLLVLIAAVVAAGLGVFLARSPEPEVTPEIGRRTGTFHDRFDAC